MGIEPIRILHIVHKLDLGGMESRIMDIYRNLDHEKYQYDFYVESGEEGIFDEEVCSLGGRIFLSKGKRCHNIPHFKVFRQFLEKHKEYKIVYAYNQWAGLYLKQATKCKIPFRIANARTSIQTKSIKNNVKKLVKLNTNRYATHKFAVSKKAAIWLFGNKEVDAGNVKIWPNAIDTERYAYSNKVRYEVRRELGLDNELTIIHVGNIRIEKNHRFLFDVFSEVKRNHENSKLVLVGGGDIETLKSQMQESNIIDSVIYLGVRQDIPRLLQAGDIFIFPSLYEGFPGAVLEAEASGLNCVISDSITEEVMVTDHIKALALSRGPDIWAKTVEEFEAVDRALAWKSIKNRGYDIKELANNTQRFFESLIIERV